MGAYACQPPKCRLCTLQKHLPALHTHTAYHDCIITQNKPAAKNATAKPTAKNKPVVKKIRS